jgi:hypothetical protein
MKHIPTKTRYSYTYPLEVSRRLGLLDWHRKRVVHNNRYVASRKALSPPSQLFKVTVLHPGCQIPRNGLEELFPRSLIRERDVDALLEAAADGGVQHPGQVGGGQGQHALVVVADAVHLHQELGLHAGRVLARRVARIAAAGQRVDLVDEDDGRAILAREAEEVADEPFAFANPLGRHVVAADAEQRVVALGRHRLRQVRLACSAGARRAGCRGGPCACLGTCGGSGSGR